VWSAAHQAGPRGHGQELGGGNRGHVGRPAGQTFEAVEGAGARLITEQQRSSRGERPADGAASRDADSLPDITRAECAQDVGEVGTSSTAFRYVAIDEQAASSAVHRIRGGPQC